MALSLLFMEAWTGHHCHKVGYCVVFLPFKDGKPSGSYEIFANGFTGKESVKGAHEANYRPCGLAQDTDGALYISDDKAGGYGRSPIDSDPLCCTGSG
ncbi:MAG: hypothetical protein WDO16_22980 [Bacteroidota bacterium]